VCRIVWLANVPNVRLAKFELKKCAVGKIKNTEGAAMSVGSVVVQLKYGMYVGHLSKLAFDFMFKVIGWSLFCRILSFLIEFPHFIKYRISEQKLSIHLNRSKSKILL
jgi:hypothetical protein